MICNHSKCGENYIRQIIILRSWNCINKNDICMYKQLESYEKHMKLIIILLLRYLTNACHLKVTNSTLKYCDRNIESSSLIWIINQQNNILHLYHRTFILIFVLLEMFSILISVWIINYSIFIVHSIVFE